MTRDRVPDGELAAIVTHLEMRQASAAPMPEGTLRLSRVAQPTPDQYRAIFRKVGARWLWFSRLVMDDARLESIITSPAVELYEVTAVEAVVGMLELDFRNAGECELAFVGLVPELSGQGHGRWLLARALDLAWRDSITRVHVHTCTLDHPAALPAYLRAGFKAVRREVEHFPDPRLAGILPADCAPQVPLLGTLTCAEAPAS
ncbi:GNAT family N-acetyltransferase [Sphingomonas lutea]|uniref:GNAT family N-acetyltransferase n=1 Tax=Sphingomonas lutea TaxID=1045317 RepID=A0A7G9SGE5_9SPHN|nr:GNAT family N-acetyltransferase [Sphingomonas lutea]QNN66920.1 GNAT family N-acetyltransferase [Sphingomonas lutea]